MRSWYVRCDDSDGRRAKYTVIRCADGSQISLAVASRSSFLAMATLIRRFHYAGGVCGMGRRAVLASQSYMPAYRP